jgi:biotin operon repressor
MAIDEDQLLQMWNIENKSLTQIAAEFGTTRSAVSGLINRARQRGIPFKKKAATSRERSYKPRQAKIKAVLLAVVIEEQGPRLPVSLTLHEGTMCRAVFIYKGRTAYCAWPRLPGRSYCATCDFGKSYVAAPARTSQAGYKFYR